MFYTEYRPQKFADLLGADHIISGITKSLKEGKIAHAYFFTGGRGIGKTTTARLLAKALNCKNPIISTENSNIHYEPCGQCSSCLSIQAGNYLDLIEIDAASNRSIDDIRVLKEGIGLSPTMGNKKVYIIDEVHMLTPEASNALLKTLEEPPSHAYFILCTTNPEKVLETIKSRCIQINFKRPDLKTISDKLKKIIVDKGVEVSEQEIEKIARLAKGAYREAETYLEQYINGGGNISLIAQNDSFYNQLTKNLLDKDLKSSIELINDLFANGMNIERWTDSYVEYLRAILFERVGISSDNFILSSEDKILAKTLPIIFIKDTLKAFLQSLTEFKLSPYPVIPIEMAIMDVIIKSSEQGEKTSTNNVIEPKTPNREPKMVEKNEQKISESINPIKEKSQGEVPNSANKTTKRPSGKFPYKQMVESLKDSNHSIYLLLSACKLSSYETGKLILMANYSFHKERVLSTKIRTVIEDAASKICGDKVIVKCELSSENPDGQKLTDLNVTSVNKPALEDVFYNVFGDELEQVAE